MARKQAREEDGEWTKGQEAPYAKVVPGGFQPPTRAPCRECPLRRAAMPGYLGGYIVREYLEILHSDVSIACHLSPGFPDVVETQRHCTGVAAYRANVCKKPCTSGAAEAVELIGPDREQFLASPTEFRNHHHESNARIYGEHGEKRRK